MTIDKPLVSIIIVSWNGERFLQPCIDSIVLQTCSDFEIIVVDNGSDDGSIALLERLYGNGIRLVKTGENIGFAAGNNRGIAQARGEYIVTLNNDTVVERTWLEELVKPVRGDATIGMVGSKILLIEKPGLLDSVGVNIYPDGMSRQRGHLEPDDGRYSSVEEILLPSACAALYRKTMLDEIGLFDDDFFIYCEDTDLGLRGRLAGWKAVVAPGAIVRHHYSSAMGKHSARKAFLVERNHIWLALKTMPVSMIITAPFFSVLRLTIQGWNMVTFTSGKPKNKAASVDAHKILIALFSAYIMAIAGIPANLRKRTRITALKKVSNNEIRRWFRRFPLQARHLCLDPQ